jgi:PAS domain S-box-containing protein
MAFAVLIAMLVGIGDSGLRRMKEIDRNLSDIAGRSDKLQLARKALTLSNSNSRITLEIFLVQGRALVDPLLAERSENSKKIAELLVQIASRCESEKEKRLLSAVEVARKPYVDSYLRALHLLVDEGDRDAAVTVMVNETLPAILNYHAAWNEFVDFQNNQRDLATKQTEVDYVKGRHAAFLMMVLVVAGALAIALVSIREMTREIASRIEAEKQLRLLVDSAEDYAIFMLDPSGRVTSWNQAAERIKGYKPNEIIGRHFSCFYPSEDVKTGKPERELQIATAEGRYEDEGWRIRRDGSRFWANVIITALWDGAGKLRGFSKISRDITEHRLAEERLQESEERHRKLFDNNPHPTWVFDRETMRFLAVNAAAVRKYGYSRDEFLDMTLKDIRPSQDVPALLETVRALGDGNESSGAWRHRLKDGTVIDTEHTSYALNFLGRAARVVVAVDVTQRKRDEAEKREVMDSLAAANQELGLRNREVERATQMKSKFLASMSHELRTPLNAIVGFSDLLAEGTSGALNTKQRRFVNHITQGAAHLLQLINDILDLSKVEAGQLELHTEEFLVQAALPEVLSIIDPLAMAKNIRLEQKLESKSLVRADRVRFKQILYNLLSNAVKFTPKGGQISIECVDDWDFVRVSVTDTGTGIRPEDQEVIFDEFRQGEGRADGVHEGTGLGLAITRRLVEQQGGRITLKSEFGEGSCFTFSLPAVEPRSEVHAVEEPTKASVTMDSGRLTPLVLIVDDEEPARELLASYLEPEYRVAMAESGVEALKEAQRLRPDAITLDVMMPDSDGFETLVALRKNPATADIPVIILSIVDQKQVGFALGASDYLVKPVRKPALLATVRRHVPSLDGDDSSILLVDDDPKALELLQEALRSAGYETQGVCNGTRALEVLANKVVGAILLDLLMPGMDGFQVIRHVRQEPTLKDLPILIMTAKNLSPDEIALLNRETQGLLQKDGSWKEQLIAEVGRVIRGHKRAKSAGQA